MKVPIVFLLLAGIFSVDNVVYAHGEVQDIHINGTLGVTEIFVGALLGATVVAIIIIILNKKK